VGTDLDYRADLDYSRDLDNSRDLSLASGNQLGSHLFGF
jgi:hypothetical protein